MPSEPTSPPPGSFAKLMASTPEQEVKKSSRPKTKPRTKKESTANNTASSTANNTADNTAVLLNDSDIAALKEKAYLPRTFKMSDRESEWLLETAYRLSKELKPHKAYQLDIVRIGMKMFENALASNKKRVLEIIKELR